MFACHLEAEAILFQFVKIYNIINVIYSVITQFHGAHAGAHRCRSNGVFWKTSMRGCARVGAQADLRKGVRLGMIAQALKRTCARACAWA